MAVTLSICARSSAPRRLGYSYRNDMAGSPVDARPAGPTAGATACKDDCPTDATGAWKRNGHVQIPAICVISRVSEDGLSGNSCMPTFCGDGVVDWMPRLRRNRQETVPSTLSSSVDRSAVCHDRPATFALFGGVTVRLDS